MRLKLVPDNTSINFFQYARVTFGASVVAMVGAIIIWLVMGLNFGIDFQGGTAIRTVSPKEIDVGTYRQALQPLDLGDLTITEVTDLSFGEDENVAQLKIQAQEGQEAISTETLEAIEAALKTADPDIKFTSVDSVGPEVSGELIWSAIMAVLAATFGILAYIWLRFEWQFAIGAVAALIHDVIVTIGIFSLLQIRFDLSIVAALLTILGYSINDTVVVFDRLRENLVKYKKMPLRDVMNLSANETLSRTILTSGTTLIALIAMLILGGDVIRGFIFAITWGVVIGTYSSLYVAKNVVLLLGVDRNPPNSDQLAGTRFAEAEN